MEHKTTKGKSMTYKSIEFMQAKDMNKLHAGDLFWFAGEVADYRNGSYPELVTATGWSRFQEFYRTQISVINQTNIGARINTEVGSYGNVGLKPDTLIAVRRKA
jgi:hypothetical protein|tara:strand:- start:311 stop:622 length:312 start_codon:yes stop_codon:yes gene_type:complete